MPTSSFNSEGEGCVSGAEGAGREHFLLFESFFEFSAQLLKILHLCFGLYPSERT